MIRLTLTPIQQDRLEAVTAPTAATQGSTKCPTLSILQPSTEDLNCWISTLRQATNQPPQQSGFSTAATLDSAQGFQTIRHQLAVAEIGAPGPLGSVLCTSGIATYQHKFCTLHLDWGLVEVDASRLPMDNSPITNVSTNCLLKTHFAMGRPKLNTKC